MASEALSLGAFPSRRTLAVRPAAALQLAIVAMFTANLGRVPVLSTGNRAAPVLLHDVALVVAIGVGAIACLRARSLKLDTVALLALAFAAVGAASAISGVTRFGLTGVQVAVSLAYLVRWLVYFGVYVLVLNVATSDDAGALWRAYEKTVLAFAAFGVVQSMFLPGFAQLVYADGANGTEWDRQGHRLVSTLLDPNLAGAFLVIPLLVLLARLSFGERVRPWKLVLLLAAVLMTVSRSTILALLAGLLVLGAVRGIERRLARVLIAGALVLAPFVPVLLRVASSFNKLQVDDSALQRLISWSRAITIVVDRPWFGIGFDTYGFVQAHYGFDDLQLGSGFALDGGLLFIAVMTGAVGLALFVWMMAVVMRRCRRLWRDASRAPSVRGTALGTAAASLAIVVHSLFVNSLLLPLVAESLWLLWGLVYLHGRRAADAA